MKATLSQKLRWTLGVLSVWAATWVLLGARAATIIREQPHPFLKGVKLTGIMLGAVMEWALTALIVMLILGLALGLITLLIIGSEESTHISYRRGLVIGSGTILWVHGVLYLMVPVALATLPVLKYFPMSLSLLLMLGGGATLLIWAVRSNAARHGTLRSIALLAVISGLFFLPHDLFRRFMAGPKPLPRTEKRLLIVSVDALRKDVFEAIMPEWKTPGGSTAICALPATRLTWNVLLGAPLETMRYSKVMPSLSEMTNQVDLRLLRVAEVQGVRTAFIIDDSLTPAFGLQPNLFTTVLEPDGGWKYWFTLGFGSCWPAYSWAQNYISPVETSNIWCDTNAYFRDIDRQLETHGWVSSHNCELHSPITPRFEELRILSGWKWLWRSPNSYKSYTTVDELKRDKGKRVGLRSDANRHFNARSTLLLARLKPFLQKWEREYPALSGVVTADHGEYFATIHDEGGHVLSHFGGVHGFDLGPDTVYIPMHPFGQAVSTLTSQDCYSWLDLRTDISTWLQGSTPLRLIGNREGHLIQMPTIRAVHLEADGSAKKDEPKQGTASTTSVEEEATRTAAGIHPKDILMSTTFLDNGIWFCQDTPPAAIPAMPLSSAIVQGTRLITYNPDGLGTYARADYVGYQRVGIWKTPKDTMDRDLATYTKDHRLPPPPPQDKK
jgi:hypothetical protein